jgi:membrane associated rhomboid family serine protease
MTDRPPHGQPLHGRGPETGAPRFLWILVGVMAAIELALGLSEAGYIGSSNWRWPAFAIGAFWQPMVSGGMGPLYPGQTVLMFVTHAFLHGGFMHLALNGVILLALGKFVAYRIGAGRTLLVLFASAAGGGLAFGLLASSTSPMIGASGAVFGLIGVWQAWDYQMRRTAGLPLQPLLVAILGLVLANVVFFVILGGGLAWQAHLGGWLAGFGLARYFGHRAA